MGSTTIARHHLQIGEPEGLSFRIVSGTAASAPPAQASGIKLRQELSAASQAALHAAVQSFSEVRAGHPYSE